MEEKQLYKCRECGWTGTEDKMLADFAGELWSNWICPSCGTWWAGLEDYDLVEDKGGTCEA